MVDFLTGPEVSDISALAVTDPMTLTVGEPHRFTLTVTFEFINYSDAPARIAIVSHNNSEFLKRRQGQEFIVPPQETRHLVWQRHIISDQLSEDNIGNPDLCFLQLEYWTRDLGANIRDTFRFNLDLRYFSRDGSRLIVQPQPAFPWHEGFGEELSPRLYERLEAAKSNIGPDAS
jgi:hypothetical protein